MTKIINKLFILFTILILINCSRTNSRKLQSNFIVKTENKNNLPIIIKRLKSYAKYHNIKLDYKEDGFQKIEVKINKFIKYDQLINLIKANGEINIKGGNTIFTMDDFKISYDSYDNSIFIDFNESAKYEIQKFINSNYKKNIFLYLGDSLVATPLVKDSINTSGFGLPLGVNSNYNTSIIKTVINNPFRHGSKTEITERKLFFDKTIISDSLIKKYNEIKKDRRFYLKLYRDRMNYLDHVYALSIFTKIYYSDFEEFVEDSNFESYNFLENFITVSNKELKAYQKAPYNFERTLRSITPLWKKYDKEAR